MHVTNKVLAMLREILKAAWKERKLHVEEQDKNETDFWSRVGVRPGLKGPCKRKSGQHSRPGVTHHIDSFLSGDRRRIMVH